MNKIKCPLCGSSHCNSLENIKKDDLIHLYKRAFNVDVATLINSDISYTHCQECDLRFFVDKNNQMPTGDDGFYNALNKFPWYYMGEKKEYQYAKKYIKATDKVLEVGCGKAAFAKFIPTKDYTGLEFSTDAKKLAAKSGITIENISIQEYAKKRPNCFDIVCSFQVLEHVSNPREFIQSKLEALNGGGGTDDCCAI